MTKIVCWNVQCGLAIDGQHEIRRPAWRARTFTPDADVVCFQEVARAMPELDGGRGEDQPAALAEVYRGYEAVFGPAISRHEGGFGPRREFGNLILSRLPVVQAFFHALPQPADDTVKHMPRQATEVVVRAPFGPLRVTTTHLEYHSYPQRFAQAARLLDIQKEVEANAARPSKPGEGPYAALPRPADGVLCGDFNVHPDRPVYQAMLRPGPDGRPVFQDAWRAHHREKRHAPTCGVADRKQWPEGPHCRDFFFVTPGIAARIENVEVDAAARASDHQPIVLTLRDD